MTGAVQRGNDRRSHIGEEKRKKRRRGAGGRRRADVKQIQYTKRAGYTGLYIGPVSESAPPNFRDVQFYI